MPPCTSSTRIPPPTWIDHRVKAAKRKGLSLEWVAERIQARLAARRAREWAGADMIRDELLAKGVALMDRPDGDTDWMVQDEAAAG